MSSREHDKKIDDQLRDVELPDELLGCMRQIATGAEVNDVSRFQNRRWSDSEIDRNLVGVPVADDFLQQLKEISNQPPVDAIENSLTGLEIPKGMLEKLVGIPQQMQRREWIWAATAACMLIVAGIGLLSMSNRTPFGLQRAHSDREDDNSQSSPTDDRVEHVEGEESVRDLDSRVADNDARDNSERKIDRDVIQSPDAASALEDGQPSEVVVHEAGGNEIEFDLEEDHSDSTLILPEQLAKSKDNPFIQRWPVHAAPAENTDLIPELEFPVFDLRTGMRVPKAPTFNRNFLLSHRTHPVVAVASDMRLQYCRPPLNLETTSFDQLRAAIATGDWAQIEAVELRTEDVLASMSYDFNTPEKGTFGLSVELGPSPFGSELPRAIAKDFGFVKHPSSLMQIGIKATEERPRKNSATSMTLVIDVSGSMKSQHRFDKIILAVEHLCQQMNDRDLITLVLCGERTYSPLRYVGKDGTQKLVEFLERVKPAGGSQLSAGLQLAFALAHQRTQFEIKQDNEPLKNQVVLISDGAASLTQGDLERVDEMMRLAIDSNVDVSGIELSENGSSDAFLADLSSRGNGEHLQSLHQRRLSAHLLRILTGVTSMVARDVEIELQFFPMTVSAYRLLGHEPDGAGLLVQTSPGVDLYRGEEATLLFEWWPVRRPRSVRFKFGDLASAKLKWVDPLTGFEQSQRLPIENDPYSAEIRGNSPAFQQAAFAAEFAEVFRESPFVDHANKKSFNDLTELADHLSPEARQSRSMQQMLQMIQAYEALKKGRASAKTP